MYRKLYTVWGKYELQGSIIVVFQGWPDDFSWEMPISFNYPNIGRTVFWMI
ncbi:MAG: hypothetical protein ACLU6Z_06265 [Odoribacter splanchnicus]